jgi:hypothetical protein
MVKRLLLIGLLLQFAAISAPMKGLTLIDQLCAKAMESAENPSSLTDRSLPSFISVLRRYSITSTQEVVILIADSYKTAQIRTHRPRGGARQAGLALSCNPSPRHSTQYQSCTFPAIRGKDV